MTDIESLASQLPAGDHSHRFPNTNLQDLESLWEDGRMRTAQTCCAVFAKRTVARFTSDDTAVDAVRLQMRRLIEEPDSFPLVEHLTQVF